MERERLVSFSSTVGYHKLLTTTCNIVLWGKKKNYPYPMFQYVISKPLRFVEPKLSTAFINLCSLETT